LNLVDAQGQPINTRALHTPQTHQVAIVAQRRIESRMEGMTPSRMARLLREADAGQLPAQAQIFDDMLDRDAHLRAEYDKRRAAPVGLLWSIAPPHHPSRAEKAATDFVQECLSDTVDDLEDLFLAMADAPGFGYSAIEIEWQKTGKEWLPQFHPRPQSWLCTDLYSRTLRLDDGTGQGAPLQPMGWIVHTPGKIKTGYLGRAGLFRACVWPFLYKAYALSDFAEFLETYGLPIIVGKYMAGASAEEKASLLRAVTALGHDARAIMPQGMDMEIQSVSGGGTQGVHLAMVDWADRAQSKAILGQTTSAEAHGTGLGSGVATLHGQVRRDILRSDARQMAGTLTRDLVYPLVALNRPGIDGYRRCPRFVFETDEPEDLTRYADALPKLVGVGFRIPQRWAQDKLHIPQPDADEPVLSLSRPPFDEASAPAPTAALSAKAPTPRPTDPVATLATQLGEDTAPPIEAWLADIQKTVMDERLTTAQLQERLLLLYGDLPMDTLVQIMARAYEVAQLAGHHSAAPPRLPPSES
jgi:phage gp29-like protein